VPAAVGWHSVAGGTGSGSTPVVCVGVHRAHCTVPFAPGGRSPATTEATGEATKRRDRQEMEVGWQGRREIVQPRRRVQAPSSEIRCTCREQWTAAAAGERTMGAPQEAGGRSGRYWGRRSTHLRDQRQKDNETHDVIMYPFHGLSIAPALRTAVWQGCSNAWKTWKTRPRLLQCPSVARKQAPRAPAPQA